MKNLILSFVVALFFISGCGSNGQNNNSMQDKSAASNDSKSKPGVNADTNVIKVYVNATGIITADGNAVSLNVLDSSFSILKEKNGTVYYSRFDTGGEPPENSMQVMELIVKHGLPLRFYTDKTFTVPVEMH